LESGTWRSTRGREGGGADGPGGRCSFRRRGSGRQIRNALEDFVFEIRGRTSWGNPGRPRTRHDFLECSQGANRPLIALDQQLLESLAIVAIEGPEGVQGGKLFYLFQRHVSAFIAVVLVLVFVCLTLNSLFYFS
jgi:hypothetical protein